MQRPIPAAMSSLMRRIQTTRRMPRAIAGSIRTAHLTLGLRPLVVALLRSLCITTCAPSHHIHRPPFLHQVRNTLAALELQAILRTQLLVLLRAQLLALLRALMALKPQAIRQAQLLAARLLPARILRLPASRSLIHWLSVWLY